MTHPNSLESGSRVTSTKKWRKIFSLFNINTEQEESPSYQVGDGVVQFLSGDIKGLETRLKLLLAEYRAGNKSSLTRNQIVSILDELLHRKRLLREEYRDINKYLQ